MTTLPAPQSSTPQSPAPPRPSPRRSSVLRSAALVVVWSSGFIGAELGAPHAPPTTSLAWRFLATAVVLLPWLLRALPRLDAREWGRQAVVALLAQCLYLGGVFAAAAAGVPAGTSALVASLQPALVLVVAARQGHRPLRRRQVVGLLLGTTGVALTAAGDLRSGVALAALLLPLGAMLALTAGTVLQQRWSHAPVRSSPGPTVLGTLAVQSLVGAVLFTATAAASGDLVPPATVGFWTAVLWSTLAGLGSYALYYLVTARDGAARASVLLYLTPATTAVWAAGFFGEALRAGTIAGLLVSGCAVALLAGRPRGAPRPAAPQ